MLGGRVIQGLSEFACSGENAGSNRFHCRSLGNVSRKKKRSGPTLGRNQRQVQNQKINPKVSRRETALYAQCIIDPGEPGLILNSSSCSQLGDLGLVTVLLRAVLGEQLS